LKESVGATYVFPEELDEAEVRDLDVVLEDCYVCVWFVLFREIVDHDNLAVALKLGWLNQANN
jgi:hypothetical protein